MKTLLLNLATFTFAAALLPLAALADAPAGFLRNGVTAHRGNSDEQPENTLSAFRSAIELRVDWIELDVYRTKDGRLVVIHDATTANVGDKELRVAESTYDELQTIDVATGFRKKHGLSAEQCPVHQIPTLEEVLRLVITQPNTRASLQPKMNCVDDIVALVKRLEAQRWVGFNDGNMAYMSRVKELAPEVPVFWDLDRVPTDEDLRAAQDRHFEAIVLRHDLVTKEAVDRIKATGREVGAWTVNDGPTIERLLELGVQRLYTDCPAKLLALQEQSHPLRHVECEGRYPGHLQGVCMDDAGALFWSFTTVLVKTDAQGHVLKKIDVASHHGDLCHHDGQIYVAVNLGKFNDPNGNAESWVYVYNAADLAEVARHKTAEVFHGAGGIAYDGQRFLVVGGLPENIEENYAYEYDREFHFVKRHAIASGQTRKGIQTAAYAQGCWWFGCYGDPKVMLKTDGALQMLGRYEYDASLGIIGLPDGRFLIAGDKHEKGVGHAGSLRLAKPDAGQGMKLVP
jgi:glycerophosphoryl diester phosphodiesterase